MWYHIQKQGEVDMGEHGESNHMRNMVGKKPEDIWRQMFEVVERLDVANLSCLLEFAIYFYLLDFMNAWCVCV